MKSSSNRINIIVVDDNISNLAILKEVLEHADVEIISSNIPTRVVDLCISQEISIALIDVQMPEMSGFELLNQLKSNPLTKNIVVILMTGYSMSTEEVFLGLSSGAVDYLFKPLDLHITSAKVHSLLTLINYQRDIEKKNKELEQFQLNLYQAVEEAKKGKEIKENFLANMSHEIRTPLNAIVGITNLLKVSDLNVQQRKMIELMDFSSNALLGIVNDILESFQIDSGKITLNQVNTNVATLFTNVGETMQPLAIEKGLMLNYEIIGLVPSSLIVDPLRLKQILMNLINNAIKFTPIGKIDVTLKASPLNNGQAVLTFDVKDTGLGIPENSINLIFERFEQVEDKTWQKFGGTGLGLSIVKKLAELMGGKIEIQSTQNVGTTFSFIAPFEVSLQTAEEPDNTLIKSLATLYKFDNVRVLLAEDNVINQFVAVRMLQSWNIKVTVALNGLEAFHKVSVEHFDLILMDTHMPVMNGLLATKKIRDELGAVKNKIPIISFSASVIAKERQEAIDAGVDDFLEKPFNPQVLHEKIATVIRLKYQVM